MAELYPELIEYLIIAGTVVSMTDSISQGSLRRIGFSSSFELLLPTLITGLKELFSMAFTRNFSYHYFM